MNKIDEIMEQVDKYRELLGRYVFGEVDSIDVHRGYVKLRTMIESALKVPDGWQPIESAPKDGMIVLLRGKRAIADGFFNGKAWIWPYINAEPIHWMPLPNAPI